MKLIRMAAVGCLLGSTLVCGCSRSAPTIETHRHNGAIVNIADLVGHPAAYKGKTMTLVVKIDEEIVPGKGQSLRDFVGRDVKFTALGNQGERANMVIKIPHGLNIPEAYRSDELRVTFICTQGDLRRGNEAKSIDRP